MKNMLSNGDIDVCTKETSHKENKMKVKKKKGLKGIPSSSSLSGFSREVFDKLNQGKAVEIDSIPPNGKEYVETIKGGK